MECMSKRDSKYRRNDDDTLVALDRESILNYAKHISDMCNTQKALGWNTNGVAKSSLVRNFLDTLEKEKVKRRRLNYEDIGKNALNDGYLKEELKKHGKIEHGSSLRHRDVEVCSVGALTLYLFSRFHFENEEFPNFEKRENWYKTVVFKGDSPFKAIQYKAQHSTYVDIFKKVGIHTSKVTHANRKSALNMIAQENVSGDQQRMVGRWGTDRMVGCYVSSLPVEAMKSLAGFNGQQHSNYFLPRAVIKPSLTLQRLVFKDIEYWKERFNTGHDIQEDIAGPNFLNLLAYRFATGKKDN
ncbi:hypothetical protein G6F47_009448 [Rhizopus delemar]|uniref:Ndc10 domain-containing protein n=2 Tax=Rhizopus TaxID=4842 RepID=A0A9P6Z087_9FUNG|nr:hypothetical protein G6F50_008008 [Rhizopus delemar]KAG1592418.1 hypothetical protein G6F47_009448 [Rhizopus delemar]KAG1592966.1 hypothetical protein G6F48_002310 [Rhizopus delemar]KAG1627108.1 hypothetical protein G6F45_007899 [Rhizopus arrhizus]KAG1638246.1 hypothetical protein G6F44_009022 [Rhizopus delemar]